MQRAILICTLLVAGCTRECAPERPECAPGRLAEIEKQYLEEALTTCAGQTYDSCPHLPAIRAKHKKLRDAWKECQ